MNKVLVSVITCDKRYENFMNACGIGVDHIGMEEEFIISTTTEITDEYLRGLEKHIESMPVERDSSGRQLYYTNARACRIFMEQGERIVQKW